MALVTTRAGHGVEPGGHQWGHARGGAHHHQHHHHQPRQPGHGGGRPRPAAVPRPRPAAVPRPRPAPAPAPPVGARGAGEPGLGDGGGHQPSVPLARDRQETGGNFPRK